MVYMKLTILLHSHLLSIQGKVRPLDLAPSILRIDPILGDSPDCQSPSHLKMRSQLQYFRALVLSHGGVLTFVGCLKPPSDTVPELFAHTSHSTFGILSAFKAGLAVAPVGITTLS